MGIHTHFSHYVDSMAAMLAKDYDVVFVGTGAPRGRDLDLPGRKEGDSSIHVGIDWLAGVIFGVGLTRRWREPGVWTQCLAISLIANLPCSGQRTATPTSARP